MPRSAGVVPRRASAARCASRRDGRTRRGDRGLPVPGASLGGLLHEGAGTRVEGGAARALSITPPVTQDSSYLSRLPRCALNHLPRRPVVSVIAVLLAIRPSVDSFAFSIPLSSSSSDAFAVPFLPDPRACSRRPPTPNTAFAASSPSLSRPVLVSPSLAPLQTPPSSRVETSPRRRICHMTHRGRRPGAGETPCETRQTNGQRAMSRADLVSRPSVRSLLWTKAVDDACLTAVYCSFVISECWASRPPSRSQRGRLKRDEVSCRLCCAVTGRKKCALACPANARSDDGQSQSQPHERRDLD